MKKLKKGAVVTLLLVMLISFVNQTVFASSGVDSIQRMEYSQEFLEWMNLTEEQKEQLMMPIIYDVPNTKVESKNPFYITRMLGSSLDSKYSLKDVIPNNLAIRNQEQTNSCWAFSALSSLETNLALLNYKKGINSSKVYDYSERHMEYATSRIFANNVENPIGYNRKVGGGNWYISIPYLTNGTGAIEESEMPFENNEDLIDISKIQNKTVTSQVYDTKVFPITSSEDNTELKNQIKEHIQNYGSVSASIHGASLDADCYNNETGAIYCNNSTSHNINHAISIIGWDDNYSIENFNEDIRPQSNGAWIIRNSWGEKAEYDLAELKEALFKSNESLCIANGWTDATLIPDEVIEKLGYTVENGKAILKIGDNGIMYVSYEDCNIYSVLNGIIKSSDKLNYENIYQYDEYFAAGGITVATSKCMLANNFNKKTTGTEYLTQVSLYAPETYTCRVYVNPNGTSKAKSDLQLVSLKTGESETFDAGYHTIEFLEPIEIKSSSFAVVVEIQGTQNNMGVMLESKLDKVDLLDYVVVENDKCFIALENNLENCQWIDLGKLSQQNSSLTDGDSTIKAFTVSKVIDDSLKNIEITTQPTKTLYYEGQNFDSTGMIVKANYNDGTSYIVDSWGYSITNGSNLKEGQASVTITYEDKSVEQPITVEKNSVVSLEIKNPPTKTEYKEGQHFDKTGMIIEATRKDGTKEQPTDYTIENGYNLKNNQTEVIISYEEKTVQQSITVTPNPLLEINIGKEPDKTKYVVGQNFDKTGMIVMGTFQDGDSVDIVEYTIENGTNLTKDQTSVTISYEGKTTTQPITVEEKSITEMLIESKPNKLTYVQNKEELDLTGGSLKVTYNDGTTENISMTSEQVTVTGFSNKNLGKIMLTITYQTKTVQLEVEIIAEVVEEKAQNSNFDNATSDIKKVQAYYFTNNSKENYTLIELEVNGIVRNLNNDKCEYYYYLSPNKEENNIKEWVKITETQNYSDKLIFTLNSKEIPNYEEICNESVLYLYIKEVAIKGGNQSVAISSAIKLESNVSVEKYVNNAKQENLNSSTNISTEKDDKEDKTIASGKLPNTGIKITVIVFIFITIGIGLVLYIKYKKLSKYVK